MTATKALPTLNARQMEDLARELGSKVLMEAADEQYRREQEMLHHRIGRMTMKVVDGKHYQYRPHGWVEVRSLGDIVFEDVRELPIDGRVRSVYPCRIEFEGESHRVNVDIPCRNDITQKVLDERLARALARLFDFDVVDVHIGHRDSVTTLRVTNRDDVHTLDMDLVDVPMGGARLVSLEV